MFGKSKPEDDQSRGEQAAVTSEPLRCSFCQKAKDDVNKLVAGPAVFICDSCVEVCVGILVEDAQANSVSDDSGLGQHWRSVAAKLRQDSPVTCSLCGNTAREDEMLAIAERGMICGRCADAVDDALARGRLVDG